MNRWAGALEHHYSLTSTSESNVKSEGRKEGVAAEAYQYTTVRRQLVGQGRAGQGRAGQRHKYRAEAQRQGRGTKTGQGRAGQDRAGQGRGQGRGTTAGQRQGQGRGAPVHHKGDPGRRPQA